MSPDDKVPDELKDLIDGYPGDLLDETVIRRRDSTQ
jgi:hypothetical protein